MKLSIVVPVYNLENYVMNCLRSLKQMECVNDYEIIIVNDGSSDHTQDIVEKFKAENNLNITILKKPNGGVSSARNLGIEKAIGDYILFIDGDDTLTKDSIKNIIDHLNQRDDIDIYAYPFYSKSEDGIITKRYSDTFHSFDVISGEEAFRLKNKKYFWICQGSAVYKRSLLLDNELRFPEQFKIGEDIYFTNMALYCSRYVKFLQAPGVEVLIRKNSAMRTVFNEKYYDGILLNRKLKERVSRDEHGKELAKYCDLDYVNLITDYVKRYIQKTTIDEYKTYRQFHKTVDFDDIGNAYDELSKKKKLEWQLVRNHPFLYYLFTKLYKGVGK